MSNEQKTLIEGETKPVEVPEKAPVKKKRSRTNEEVIESYERLAKGVIETGDKVDQLCQINDVLVQRIDELQITIEDRLDAGTAAAPEPAPTQTTAFREEPPKAPEPPVTEGIGEYLTSKEVFNYYTKQLDRREGELADKRLKTLLERICYMREDFVKLTGDMEKNIKQFTAKDILSSFSAYLVDIDNMITEAGVIIGPYQTENNRVDVMHQKIVKVLPTNEQAKDETVAERLTPGYEFEGRSIIREKVNVYKVSEQAPAQVTGFREAP